jgi:hypothetical protein
MTGIRVKYNSSFIIRPNIKNYFEIQTVTTETVIICISEMKKNFEKQILKTGVCISIHSFMGEAFSLSFIYFWFV